MYKGFFGAFSIFLGYAPTWTRVEHQAHDDIDATSTMEFLQMREGISSSLAHHHVTAPHQEIKGGLSPRWPQDLDQKVSTLDGM